MPDKDDVFKRYLEAGLSFFEMTQQRAEAALKDLSGSGESAKGQAQKAVDWVKERGRQGTDELRELVRNEIRSQIDALGLATKDDVVRIEARLAALEGAGSVTGRSVGVPAAKKAPGPRKAAGVTKAGTTSSRKAAGQSAGATVPAMKKATRPAAGRSGAEPPGTAPGSAGGTGAAPDEKA